MSNDKGTRQTVNKKWAERTKAVLIFANNPKLTAEQAFSLLFNIPAGALVKEAHGMQARFAEIARADIARATEALKQREALIAANAAAAAKEAKTA